MRRAPLVALAGLCACPPPSYDGDVLSTAAPDHIDSSDEGASVGAAGTSSTDEAPTTGEPAATTASESTGETTAATSWEPPETTTEAVNVPPEILELKATPGVIEQVGIVLLEIATTPDVVEATVVFGESSLKVPVVQSPTVVEIEVTSQSKCLGSQFEVTVRDIRGLTDSDSLALGCQIPQSGSEVFTTPLDGSAAHDVALLPDDGALVAGVKDGRMAVWAVDAAGQVMPGWPKTIDTWSLDPKFDALPSTATTVARDANGAIFVGGIVKEPMGLRRYVAKFNSQGFLIWEDPGATLGEEISGLAVSTEGVTVAVGAIRTSPPNDPPAFDLGVWGYPPEFPQAQAWSDAFKALPTDPDPDVPNKRSERGYDAAALPGGEVIVVGDREYLGVDLSFHDRAVVLRYASDGTRIGMPWTSSGVKFLNDGARSVTRTQEGYATVGWGNHLQNGGVRQVLIHRFDLAGNLLGIQPELSAPSMQGEGISQDREKKLVVAATTFGLPLDAWIFGTIGADQPHAWDQNESKTIAAAIECDDWGECTWVGTMELNGASAAVVSKRAP